MCEQHIPVDPIVGLAFFVLIFLITIVVLLVFMRMSQNEGCLSHFLLPLFSMFLVVIVLWPVYYVFEWVYLSTYGRETRAVVTALSASTAARTFFRYQVDYQYVIESEDGDSCVIQTYNVATPYEWYTSLERGDTIIIRYSQFNPHASIAEFHHRIVLEGTKMYGITFILSIIAGIVRFAFDKRNERLNHR